MVEGARQIGYARAGQPLDRARARASSRGAQRGAAALGENQARDARGLRDPSDGAEILGIFHPIERDERGGLGFGRLQQSIERELGQWLGLECDALGVARARRDLREARRGDRFDGDPRPAGRLDDRADLRPLTALANPQHAELAALGADRLQRGVHAGQLLRVVWIASIAGAAGSCHGRSLASERSCRPREVAEAPERGDPVATA